MLSQHREVIRKNCVLLNAELPCRELLHILYQDGFMSNVNVMEIMERLPSERNMFFLLLIQRKGPEAFEALVRALKTARRADLVEVLMG